MSLTSTSLKEVISSDVAYFDEILQFIPANVYFAPDEYPDEIILNQYARNLKQNTNELNSKDNRAASKRARYDSDAAKKQSVPELLLAMEKAKRDEEGIVSDDDMTSGNATSKAKRPLLKTNKGNKFPGLVDADYGDDDMSGGNAKKVARIDRNSSTQVPSISKAANPAGPSIEDLRARLHAKMAELRQNREKKGRPRHDHKKSEKNDALKKSSHSENSKSMSTSSNASASEAKSSHTSSIRQPTTSTHMDDSAMDVAFGAISTALPSGLAVTQFSTKMSGAPGSKTQKLKDLRDKAQKYRDTLNALESSGDLAAKASLQFSHALARSQGEAVLDDPKLLAKALQRRQKSKEKSTKQWADRKAADEEKNAERQEERARNIANKKTRALKRSERPEDKEGAKDNTKQGSKPNKHHGNNNMKGQARAGFEGRKNSFISK